MCRTICVGHIEARATANAHPKLVTGKGVVISEEVEVCGLFQICNVTGENALSAGGREGGLRGRCRLRRRVGSMPRDSRMYRRRRTTLLPASVLFDDQLSEAVGPCLSAMALGHPTHRRVLPHHAPPHKRAWLTRGLGSAC